MKRHLFYTFLLIFTATSVVTLLGVTGIVHIVEGYLWPLVGAFLLELAGAVVAIFRRARFFDELSGQSMPVGFISVAEHEKAMAAVQQTTKATLAAADARHRQEMERTIKLYSEGKGIVIPESILRQEEARRARHDR